MDSLSQNAILVGAVLFAVIYLAGAMWSCTMFIRHPRADMDLVFVSMRGGGVRNSWDPCAVLPTAPSRGTLGEIV